MTATRTPKSHGDGCIAAHALDLIGNRWALLIVRELMLGPKRFGAIKARLPGIATNMLARRLDDLAAAGVLARRAATTPPGAQVYDLTDHGRALAPVIRALCRWGAGMPGHDPDLPISPTSLMLSMQAMLRPDADCGGAPRQAAFTLDDECFAVTVDAGRLCVGRTDRPAVAALHFRGAPNAMARAVYGPLPLSQATAAGQVSVDGDLGRAQAFVDLFRLVRPDPP